MGNLPYKFGHAKPLGSGIIRYVRDGRTDRRTDERTDRAMLIAPGSTVGARGHNNRSICKACNVNVKAESEAPAVTR